MVHNTTPSLSGYVMPTLSSTTMRNVSEHLLMTYSPRALGLRSKVVGKVGGKLAGSNAPLGAITALLNLIYIVH